jgi:cytochrome b561
MPNRRHATYDRVARLLHWVVAALIAAQFAVAWTMPPIHHDTPPIGLVEWHLSLGTAILAVMAVRLIWRWTHPAPPLPDTVARPLRLAAHVTHVVLYALLIAIPLLGWVNASSRGYAVSLFGLVALPPLAATGSSIGHSMGDVHSVLATVLAVIIGLHVLGALYHRLVLRDEVLRRIVPGA